MEDEKLLNVMEWVACVNPDSEFNRGFLSGLLFTLNAPDPRLIPISEENHD